MGRGTRVGILFQVEILSRSITWANVLKRSLCHVSERIIRGRGGTVRKRLQAHDGGSHRGV